MPSTPDTLWSEFIIPLARPRRRATAALDYTAKINDGDDDSSLLCVSCNGGGGGGDGSCVFLVVSCLLWLWR